MIFSDNLVSMIAEYIKYNPWLVQVGLGSLLVGFLVSMILKYKAKAAEAEKQAKKKDKPVKKNK